jgi:hypothetical protein
MALVGTLTVHNKTSKILKIYQGPGIAHTGVGWDLALSLAFRLTTGTATRTSGLYQTAAAARRKTRSSQVLIRRRVSRGEYNEPRKAADGPLMQLQIAAEHSSL